MKEYILEVDNLTKHFPINGGVLLRKVGDVHALNGVTFKVKKGETLGVVGESGCGKSTLGKTLLRLHRPTSGSAKFLSKDLFSIEGKELREMRKDIQMIFQDPYESLNARHSVRSILHEPFEIHKIGDYEFRESEAKRLLNRVGLPPSALDRFSFEFSGGQRQRIGIARAIALNPKLVVCDEPVSALDVSVQSQVLNLMLELQQEMDLTYIFIAHDLAVVRHISDNIAVMYLGNIVEYTDADTIYEKPRHPYTKALISAIPVPDPRFKGVKQVLEGDIPSPRRLPTGCHFHTRCPIATDKCRKESPILRDATGTSEQTHLVSCHYI